MRTREVIAKTKKFIDFYGQDLSDTTNLNNKKDCGQRLKSHRRFLEDQNKDALNDIDNFITKLGIEYTDE
jgi:hypothetical protein